MKTPLHHKFIFITMLVGLVLLIFSCAQSAKLNGIKIELDASSEEVANLLKNARMDKSQVNSSWEKTLEINTLLLISYFSEGGSINLDMTSPLIEALEYYQEHSDYLNTPAEFQSYLPLIYGLQASVYQGIDRILATESAKKSIRDFEELIEIYPNDLVINIYYATVLGNLPKVFKAEKKALQQYIIVDDFIINNGIEDRIPTNLKKIIYTRAYALASRLQHEKVGYFKAKVDVLIP